MSLRWYNSSLPQLLLLSKGEDLNDVQMVQRTQSDSKDTLHKREKHFVSKYLKHSKKKGARAELMPLMGTNSW